MTTTTTTRRRDRNNLVGARVGLYARVSQVNRRQNDRALRERSTDQQEAEGREWVQRVSAELVGVYTDAGISASRYTRKVRQSFERLLADVEAGRLDLVWFWEWSRAQRDLRVFARLVHLCLDTGVLIAIRDRVYDVADYGDVTMLGVQNILNVAESAQTSERIRRDKAYSAAAGRPLGQIPFGYRREYDVDSGGKRTILGQEPDRVENGAPVPGTPAAVVAEIFDRIAAGDSVGRVARDLTDRRVLTPEDYAAQRRGEQVETLQRWTHATIARLAKRPAYAGQVQHQGAVLEGVETMWPPLVDEATWWRVQAIFAEKSRNAPRPARARWLLSRIARCGGCGSLLHGNGTRKRLTDSRTVLYETYTCPDRHCVGISAPALDAFVTDAIIAWLSDPAVAAALSVEDTEETQRAQANLDKLRSELQDWHRSVAAGEVTAATAAIAERGFLQRIEDAERRARDAATPRVLRDAAIGVGPQARAGWDQLDLAVKRQIITAVAEITVRPSGMGRPVHPADRVEWTWKIGPTAGELLTPPDRRAVSSVRAAIALRGLAQVGEPIRMAELAHRIGFNRADISRSLGWLEREGYVTRRAAPSTGRTGAPSPLVEITDEGRAAAADLGDRDPGEHRRNGRGHPAS
jgi:DNA invertase Pin-like site-specific DNA recombinase/DNA-binding IclR family transcriptional regulator